MPTPLRRAAPLLAFMGGSVAAWAIGGLSAVNASSTYGALNQPGWAPPPWLFGPVWSVLYILIGVAGYLAWRKTGTKTWETGLWSTQMFFNALWSPLFFAWSLRGLALAWIICLDALVIGTIVLYMRRSRLAAGLMAPYLLWILFATCLNASIWWLNR